MNGAELYGWYGGDEAIAAFGAVKEALAVCDGNWTILPDAVLCLAEIGEPPDASHFPNAGEFCWAADKPYAVRDEGHARFVPKEVVGGHADRPIHLFVRPKGSEKYRYIGRLGPAYRFTLGGRSNFGDATFDLSPALPSRVWVKLGGLKLGDLDHAAVDAALARLRGPTSVEERLGVLRRLAEYWHGPIRAEDGLAETDLQGVVLPGPLAWWFRLAGRRPEILSGQNKLLPPDRLKIVDGRLRFYVENQYCYQWATHPEGDDPPVFGRLEDADPWESEGMRLSEHLILACLFEGLMHHAPYGASSAWLAKSVVDRFVEYVPPIPIAPWRWCGRSQFHAADGAFMLVMNHGEVDGEEGCSVWIGARTEQPLQRLKPWIDGSWDSVAL